MRDRNEWFKEAKGALRHLEIEAVENPFAWPTVTYLGRHGPPSVRPRRASTREAVGRALPVIRSAVELFRATAWHAVPDLVSGPARRALAHGRADAPRVTAAQIGESERRARALERDRARALKRSRKAKR